MYYWITTATLFAEANENAQPENGGGGISQLYLIIAMAVMAYFILYLPSKREKAKRQSLLDALKKNDKVVTAGGIVGTIASISPENDEVTVKVDDNTRIRFRRSSIQYVVEPPAEGEKQS